MYDSSAGIFTAGDQSFVFGKQPPGPLDCILVDPIEIGERGSIEIGEPVPRIHLATPPVRTDSPASWGHIHRSSAGR